MDPKDLATIAADALDDKQAREIIILDVEDLVGYTSYFVLCSGRSERQVQALVDHTRRQLRTDHGVRHIGLEGVEKGRWALIDFGDVVVHIFKETERDFYDLEGLWQDAPRVEWTPSVPANQ
jgi:ribosome-associated protein